MIQSIIKKMLAKIILAAACAVLLAIITIFITDITWWMVLIMLFLVLVSFANTYIELKKAFTNGEVVAIYGNCVSIESAANFIGKPQRKFFSYRFISLAESDDDAKDDSVASFYIKGEKGKFVEGESYCLLFKKNKGTNEFNEKNLIGYEVTKTSPVTISTSEMNEDERERAILEKESNIEEKNVLPNIISFPSTQKNKEDGE